MTGNHEARTRRGTMALGMALTLGMVTLAPQGLASETPDPRVAEARSVVKEFAMTLQGELKAAMQSGGPVAAVEVCHSRAPAIARRLSEQYGWEVGRTSLKRRNPGNSPDDWERSVMERFESRKAAGDSLATLEHAATVEVDGAPRFRYMKAIPTQAVCLVCHGAESVPPEVAARLAAYYPDDQARGFEEGDLRGAFTLSMPAE